MKLIIFIALLALALPAYAVTFYANGSPNYFTTQGINVPLPSGATCASRIPTGLTEIRPENATANAATPASGSLTGFHASPTNFTGAPPASDFATVDGNYTGTTDQVIRWASCKWGLDENTFRAEAWDESVWSAYTTGDLRNVQSQCSAGAWNGWDAVHTYCYQSYGLVQTKFFSFNVSPFAWNSTAFNADFRGAFWRACMNGHAAYLNGPPVLSGQGYPNYPGGTTSQMFTGCLGAWLSGDWYSSAAVSYVNTVNGFVASKPWLTTSVVPTSLAITAPSSNATVSASVTVTISMPGQGSDVNSCFACLSIDGVRQTCTPSAGPWTWNTLAQASPQLGGISFPALNGHHAIQADSFPCSGGNPKYHAAVNVTVAN